MSKASEFDAQLRANTKFKQKYLDFVAYCNKMQIRPPTFAEYVQQNNMQYKEPGVVPDASYTKAKQGNQYGGRIGQELASQDQETQDLVIKTLGLKRRAQ